MKGPSSLAGRAEPVALDLVNARLRRGSEVVELRPKEAAVLEELVANLGRLVSKRALMAAGWPDVAVTPSVLKACINRLRDALGDDPKAPRFIQTVHRRGYRFIGDLPIGDATAVATADMARAGAGARSAPSPSIVGRTPEIARLEHAFADAASRVRRVVFINGEAGLGKTALLDLFLKTGVSTDAIVGRGQCVERYGAGDAYMPLFEVLRHMCQTSGSAEISGVLAQHAPIWLAQMPGLAPPGEASTARRSTRGLTRDRMLREFADAIETLALGRPVVIAIEDLHWSDASTLDAIALLARRRDPARLLIVCTYRPEEVLPHEHPLPAFARELRIQRLSTEIALPPLTPAAVESYLAIRFPGSEIPPGVARALHERTEGHPLFLVVLTDHWVSHGWITHAGGRWDTHADLQRLTLKVPDDLAAIVERRLDRLSAQERRMVEAASVSGVRFVAASVAAAAALEVTHVDDRLSALARRRLLLRADGEETWPDGTSSGRYRFAHALFRDVIYERVPAAGRQQMHRRIARREEAAFGAHAPVIAARLAMHFEAAADHTRAVHHRTMAAQKVSAVGGYREAIGHATAALALLADRGDRATLPQELALQLLLGTARAATEGFAAASAERAYGRARELSARAGTSPESISALAGLYAFHLMRGPVSTTGEIGERLLEHAERSGSSEALVWARMALGVQRLQRGDLAAARTELEEVLARYDPDHRSGYLAIHAVDPGIAGLGYLSWALWALGDRVEAFERGRTAIAYADRSAHPIDLAHAYVLQAHLHAFDNDVDLVRRFSDQAIACSEEHGLGQYLWPAMMMRGWVRAMTGELAAGITAFRHAIGVWQGTGARYAMPRHFVLLGELLAMSGETEAAAAAIADARAATEASGERFWEPEIYRVEGELHLAAARCAPRHAQAPLIDQATRAIDRAIDIARRQQARSLETRALATRRKVAG